jgi:prevent-host-death family protein
MPEEIQHAATRTGLPVPNILVSFLDWFKFWTKITMITVGAFEAKTHLSTLLNRVAAGEEVVITKHGRPVARLVGAQQIDRVRVNDAFEKLRALRKGTTLAGLSWKELRDEGRP